MKSVICWDVMKYSLVSLQTLKLPYSGSKRKPNKQKSSSKYSVCYLLDLFFYSEDILSNFLRSIGKLLPDYKSLYPRRQSSSSICFFSVNSVISLKHMENL
jgi:hypothetical protein